MNNIQIDSDEENNIQLSANFETLNFEHNRFGKMLVLYQNQDCFISLGPDYCCFIPTFVVFSIIALMMISFVFAHSSNLIFQIATILIEGGTCISYLAVALSNPGIILYEDYADSESNPLEDGTKKLCRKCNIRVSRKSYHCRDCDVCIEEFDHHCPWTSKCIGKKNLCKFYIFVSMVPIFLVYTFVAFATVMSDVMVSGGNKYVRSH